MGKKIFDAEFSIPHVNPNKTYKEAVSSMTTMIFMVF